MSIEIKLNDRFALVEIVRQEGNLLQVKVDDKIYNVDLMHTADGTFSIIEEGHSYNIELLTLEQPKKYIAYTLYNTYDVEIIDAETRYLINRGGSGLESSEKNIFSPMPGKIVKILVSEGDPIQKGDTAVIISAMKMESEYKAAIDGIVKKINVSEGDTIEGNQILIEIE